MVKSVTVVGETRVGDLQTSTFGTLIYRNTNFALPTAGTYTSYTSYPIVVKSVTVVRGTRVADLQKSTFGTLIYRNTNFALPTAGTYTSYTSYPIVRKSILVKVHEITPNRYWYFRMVGRDVLSLLESNPR